MTLNIHTDAILTITQLTRSIKTLLEGEYRFIRITGEISNLKTPFSGHSYFSMKDDQSQIRAVLFKNQKRYLDYTLQDGQQVICFGRISVYEPRGEYQFIVDTIEQSSLGELQRKFDKLKEKLSVEGLFAESHKKKIPPYPSKMAIISSPTGAALQDFLKIASIKKSPVHFQIIPVKVQGKTAAEEIAGAIELANRLDDIEIIVLCRGGGSIEDLWAFNEEKVARAIFKSRIPVVTGIGHEVDFTIADFCADLRCPTPTGAATAVLPDISAVRNHLTTLERRMILFLNHKISYIENKYRNNMKVISDFDKVFDNLELRLSLSKTYFFQEIENTLSSQEKRFQRLLQRLEFHAPLIKLKLQEHKLKSLLSQLTYQIEKIINRKEAEFAHTAAVLNSVSPLATLARGYSIVTRPDPLGGDKVILSDASKTQEGDDLEILLHRGSLQCRVTRVH